MFLLRLVRTGDGRLWLAIGFVLGIGLLNRHTMFVWLLGAIAGLLATAERRLLFNRWAAAAALVASVIFAPNLVWDARHHWATLDVVRNFRVKTGSVSAVQFLPIQLAMVTSAGRTPTHPHLSTPAYRQPG